MSGMRARAHGISARPIWASAAAFVLVLLAASLLGISSSSADAGEPTIVEAGSAAAFHATGCSQLVADATVIDVREDHGGCEAPVSCPAGDTSCCGTACHAAANQVEVPRLYPPANEALADASALRLEVEAASPGMFRPPIG
jgi:hypothetical protein